MSQAKAFGSISIIDITDLGEFWVQPMSNMPLTIIYSPDGDTFTPSWSVSNPLIITPSLWYAGTELSVVNGNPRVTWQRQVGSDAPGNLTTNETVESNGALKVEANKFNANSTMLTYIVTAVYTEPTTNQQLTAKGQITFTLVKHAARKKDCKIVGDSIFKYNTNGTLVGSSSIAVTAQISDGLNFSGWQYRDSNGNWQNYSDTLRPNIDYRNLTINVYEDNSGVFVQDKCMLKAVTDDNAVYDMHTITKLRDGAPGQNTVTAVLSNESIMIPFNTVNGILTGDFTKAISQIYIYEGGVDVTNEWTLDTSNINTNGCTVTIPYQNSDYRIKIEDFTRVDGTPVNSATVTLTYTKNERSPVVKTITLVKVTAGIDGQTPTIYTLEPDAVAINRTAGSTNVVYSPNTITFKSYKQIGEQKTLEANRISIYKNITYDQYATAVEQGQPPTPVEGGRDGTSCSYELSGNDTTSLLGVLTRAGGTSQVLDYQTVIITKDGQQGEPGNDGDPGTPAINVIMGNYSDVIHCKLDGNKYKTVARQYIRIPFGAYMGTTRIACTFANAQLFSQNPTAIGTTTNSSAYATDSADGRIVWNIPANTEVSAANGTLTIQFTAKPTNDSSDDITITESYSWTRSIAAVDGKNAVILQIFTPNGTNVFNQQVASIQMVAQLTDGIEGKTEDPGVTWAWSKWSKDNEDHWGYQPVQSDQGYAYKLTVLQENVDSYASYRCVATYNGIGYTAYFSLFDKTDPIQVSVFSSIGEQIINNQGRGVFYVKVTQLGDEIDELKSDRFLESAPTGATEGDFYYHLNPSDRTATLKKFVNNDWVNAETPDIPTGTYVWTWRDKNGNPLPEYNGHQRYPTGANGKDLPKEGKVVYIDGTMINTKIIADVEVTI